MGDAVKGPGECRGTDCVAYDDPSFIAHDEDTFKVYSGDTKCSRITDRFADGDLCGNAIVQVEYNAMDPSCAELCQQKVDGGGKHIKQSVKDTDIPTACHDTSSPD